MILNLVAVRVGSKYSPEYVEILFDMLLRNLSTLESEVRCWCVTDAPDELPEGVKAIFANPMLPGWWVKPQLFSADMPWSEGERVAYFDLDVAITGRLEDLVKRKGISRDFGWPMYNSSVMVWDHGEHRQIWDDFKLDLVDKPARLVDAKFLPAGQVNAGDQEWITEVSTWDLFPPDWCRSYRHDCVGWPPNECKVAIFHGDPKPHAIWDGWVPSVWTKGGFTSLPVMAGVNVERSVLWDNIAENCKRDLPWFTGSPPLGNKPMVIIGGGPSLKDNLQEIRTHKRNGARIVSVNNTLDYLMSKGIKPDAHVMLDARPENAEFVKNAPDGVVYFLASQVHPDVFEALRDRDVTIWHNAADGGRLEEIVQPFEALPEKPLLPIPGGGTVGLRCMFLALFSGFRKIHIYGMDGSYDGDAHHAYSQPLNDGEMILDVVMGGKHYACSKWMARQAKEFQDHWITLTQMGMTIHVHGRGLIPDMAAILRQQLRAAA